MSDRQRRPSSQSQASAGPSPRHNPPSLVHRQVRQASVTVGSLPNTLGFVTGEPSRAHWKPDTSTQYCENCRTRFGLLTRRHHCRTCGGIFCGPCSKHVIRLDQNAEPHPAGVLSRICGDCHKEFCRRAERTAMNATVGSASVSGGVLPASGFMAGSGLSSSLPAVPNATAFGGRGGQGDGSVVVVDENDDAGDDDDEEDDAVVGERADKLGQL
ncbi:hypothetical protein BC830DRAFT_1158605, partial [Chytriomyces sp. MP71]